MRRKAVFHAIVGAVLAASILTSCVKPNTSGLPANIYALQLRANRGDPVAANNLGVAYANGAGVPQDFNEAKKWYVFASEHGNPAGEYNLAIAYERGQGTPIDLPEALKWFELASSHNSAAAKFALGVKYQTGKGVPRDPQEGIRLIHAAAVDGFAEAQAVLAASYLDGSNGDGNDGLAYEWSSLAASKLTGPMGVLAMKEREASEKGLTPAELTAAQAITAQWKPGVDPASPLQEGGGPRPMRIRGQGSGFIVGKNGEIATDYHVVASCRELRVKDPAGKIDIVSRVIADDRNNDIAVVSGGGFGARLKIAGAPPALGETIATYGFPLGPLLSNTGNMTTGSVSSVTGMQQNAKMFQITAPIQAGSSGGPVVDETGAAVGLVAAKLNALAVAASTGDLAQNVNFAWQMQPLKALLEREGIVFDKAAKGSGRSMGELADLLQKGTVKIECWR
jgi:S1-C subfamily serine protease